jgi:hypothetical protein
VKRSIRRQIKVSQFRPKLEVDEFNALTDLLFECLKEKHSACARILGISRMTWKSWEKEPPTWPWWNLIIRTAIKEYLAGVEAKRGLTAKHRRRILDRLAQIEQNEDFLDDITMLAANLSGAERHLQMTLGGKGMFWDELRKPANCGGYTERTLRKAARTLQVVKTQEGYGEDKRSYWRLPTEYDD